MLNRYPLWKYLLLVVVATLGLVYSLPNLYVPDPAIQVSGDSSAKVIDESVLRRMESALKDAGIESFGGVTDGKTAMLRVTSDDVQMKARAVIQRNLGDGFVVALNKASTTPQWLQSLGANPMKLGLDLAGGVHFLLEVDTEAALEKHRTIAADEMKEALRKERIRYSSVSATKNDKAVVGRFRDAESRDQAISKLRTPFDKFLFERVDAGSNDFRFVASYTEIEMRNIEKDALSQNLTTLRNRVNELGVAEPIVQGQGRNRIIVQLPGVQDPAEAKRVIGKTANLEFRLAADMKTPVSLREEFQQKDEIEQMRRGNAVLEKSIIVTGENVSNARSSFDPQTNQPEVNITLDKIGGDKMHRATRNNIGRQMGILFIEYKNRTEIVKNAAGEEVEKNIQYVEKRVISLATIQAALGNQFRITGLNGPGEASELALLLRSGALAAPMHFVEERVIGPSLGADNIAKGVDAAYWGMILTVIFMIVVYKMFGIFANIALTINVILIIAILSLFGATLTLPGIAGIVLTIGMAVDANILIHSRIREELAAGNSPQMAIAAGYDRAWITILDANLTNLIIAVILFAIGTGPIKGFAVTLTIGILTTIYTSVVCSRALANLVYGRRKNLQKISI